ncbi:MAG: sel1 repeat family protein [Clostridia bacterium]|nr:sel1 repeat family protein [Clostridia bacterium]
MTGEELLDTINIKTFPELIIKQLRKNNVNTKIKNLRAFYTFLLSKINEDVKNSYLNRILKYLSFSESSEILILEDIKNGIYEETVTKAFKEISDEIDKYDDNLLFYNRLRDSCKFIYFNNNEIYELTKEFDYHHKFLYLLFVHACDNYKINTPNILAERILRESYCLNIGNESKRVLLKASADLGNNLACLLYGIVIYDDFNERFKYYLKGKGMTECIWEMAFIIEHYEINEEQFKIILKEYKEIIYEGEQFLKKDITILEETTDFEKKCLITALKMYLYLANIRNYSKAYCSVGKFFLADKVAIVDDKNKINKLVSEEIALEYTKKAIKLSNIPAMQNLASYYYNNKEPNDINIKQLLQIGANAKDMLSNVYLSKVLLEENKTNEAEKYLKYISKGDNGEAQYELAKIYENKSKINEAIMYYEKAIQNQYYKAAINLGKIYFNKYMDEIATVNNKNGYLLLAINLIEKYIMEYDDETRKEAEFLLNNMKSISK